MCAKQPEDLSVPLATVQHAHWTQSNAQKPRSALYGHRVLNCFSSLRQQAQETCVRTPAQATIVTHKVFTLNLTKALWSTAPLSGQTKLTCDTTLSQRISGAILEMDWVEPKCLLAAHTQTHTSKSNHAMYPLCAGGK
jgi:hypothetical protein